jgi:hypothetical protein
MSDQEAIETTEQEIGRLRAENAQLLIEKRRLFEKVIVQETELNKLRAELQAKLSEIEREILTCVQCGGSIDAKLLELQAKLDHLSREYVAERASHTDTRRELESVKLANAEMRDALERVVHLINESTGVVGFHANGDVAPWEELKWGGRYEMLPDFDAALSTSAGKGHVAVAELDRTVTVLMELRKFTAEFSRYHSELTQNEISRLTALKGASK